MTGKKKQRLLALILSVILIISASISAMAQGELQSGQFQGGAKSQTDGSGQREEDEEEGGQVQEGNQTGGGQGDGQNQESGQVQEGGQTDSGQNQEGGQEQGDGIQNGLSDSQDIEDSSGQSQEEETVFQEMEFEQELTDEAGNVKGKITAHAPEGAFEAESEQISMEVSLLNTEEEGAVKALIQEKLSDNYYLEGYVLYRIDFLINGEKVHPNKPVAISITYTESDLTVTDIEKAHIFCCELQDLETGEEKKELTELIKKEQLLKHLEEEGQTGENLQDYTYGEITLNEERAENITVNYDKSAVYGCYVEQEEKKVQTKARMLSGARNFEEGIPYLTATDTDNQVKVTLELPSDYEIENIDKLKLHIDIKNTEDETEKETERKQIEEVLGGELNGYQKYDIYWTDSEDKEKRIELPKDTKITLEYLESKAELPGEEGKRDLAILSETEGKLTLEEGEPKGKADKNSYTTVDFIKTWDQAEDIILVSRKIFEGYISKLEITETIDGSAPFDSNDEAGNDTSDNNGIVRSYDTIQYGLQATFASRAPALTKDEATVHFQITLDQGITEAQFDVSQMLWMGDSYKIEYLLENGKVAVTKNPDGTYVDDAGKTTSINALVRDSQVGENSYKPEGDKIVSQRIIGTALITSTKENPNVLSGQKTFSVAVNVRNCLNGEELAPKFSFWMDGNEENYGEEADTEGWIQEPESVEHEATADVVTVSASGMYNLQLLDNSQMSYLSWFDFENGTEASEEVIAKLDELAELKNSEGTYINAGKSNPAKFTDEDGNALGENYAQYRYGRMTGYGLTLQLFSDSTAEDLTDWNETKGLKGTTLPVGEITFALNLTTSTTNTDTDSTYTPILWEYNENIDARSTNALSYKDPAADNKLKKLPGDTQGSGNWGRRMYWNYETRSPYGKGAGPGNYLIASNGCYYGGDWSIKKDGAVMPSEVEGNGSGMNYTFQVENYDFDFDSYHFPNQEIGNGGTVSRYTTYEKCFSSGYIQVLTVFPRVQKVSVQDVNLKVEVSNLSVTPRGGNSLSENADRYSKDNSKTFKITLYAPGSVSKGNAFNESSANGNAPSSYATGFLGTSYGIKDYDCSTYAGDNIWITGYGVISASSDNRMRAMNLLQLFDSNAFSIRADPVAKIRNVEQDEGKGGNVTFLYAADPKYQEGYDSNKEGMQEYMSSVREENLMYYKDLNLLKKAGYTCVGVLMELRDCDLKSGQYEELMIPVTVNGKDENLVNKTVSTVNTVRIWCGERAMSGISWADGEWDKDQGKNVLKNYLKITSAYDRNPGYGYQIENDTVKGYVKSEYENGNICSGTHKGGVAYGNSLLILSYKAGINITVDKAATGSGNAAYDMDKGQNLVNYTLHNIRTDQSASTGQTETRPTNLTVQATLDGGDKTGNDRRILIGSNTYTIQGYEVNEKGEPEEEEKTLTISTDEKNPTKLGYYTENKGGKKEFHVIKIYAKLDATQQKVTFEITGAPVGKSLPDISFQGMLQPDALKNNDTIEAVAVISGSGDCRAYSETAGNMDTVSIGVIRLASSFLSKSVDKTLTELDEKFTYTINYSNTSNEPIEMMYFNDLMPAPGDTRGSDYEGTLSVQKFGAVIKNSAGEELNNTETKITVYYSRTKYDELSEKINDVNEKPTTQKVDSLLGDSDYFKKLGTVEGGEFTLSKGVDDIGNLDITGLYIKVENLTANATLSMSISVKPEGNEGGDVYGNVAYSWIADNSSQILPSNQVQTMVLSRTISGLVWHDENWDGLRNENEKSEITEPLLKDVTVTLFKKNEGGTYEECKKDITGGDIQPVTTGEDGAYSFEKLAQGDYIVAFSGDVLKNFTGATDYQIDRGSNTSNDGVLLAELSELKDSDIDTSQYAYAIKYAAESVPITLHSIEDIQAGQASVQNFVEAVEHQDLGMTRKPLWNLVKCSSSSTEENLIPLANAEFELKDTNGTTYSGESGTDGTVEWTKDGESKVFTSRFPDGNYTLKETKAPFGYSLGEEITFTMENGVPKSLNGDGEKDKNGILIFYYDNEAFFALPSSGGWGVYGYMLAAILLTAAGGAVYGYRRKRLGRN